MKKLTQFNTPLNDLYTALSSGTVPLFLSKNIFYNCLFNHPKAFEKKLKSSLYSSGTSSLLKKTITTIYESDSNPAPLADPSIRKYICMILSCKCESIEYDICVECNKECNKNSIEIKDLQAHWASIIFKKKYHESKTLDYQYDNSEKNDVQRYLSGKRKLPSTFMRKHSKSQQKSAFDNEYIFELAWILQLYFITRCSIEGNLSEYRLDSPIEENKYTEYYSLFGVNEELFQETTTHYSTDVMLNNLKEKCRQEKKINSFYDLACIIWETLSYHQDHFLRRCFLDNRELEYDPIKFPDPERVLLNDHLEFYDKYIAIYGLSDYERLEMLKRNYKKNVYAACDLGCLYYFGGAVFFTHSKYKISIEKDLLFAAECFRQCITCSKIDKFKPKRDIIYPHGAWSYAHIILNNPNLVEAFDPEYTSRTDELAKKICIMCGDYAPAKNTLSTIYRKAAEEKYNLALRDNNLQEKTSEIVEDIINATNAALDALFIGSQNAGVNLFTIMNSEMYKELHGSIISHQAFHVNHDARFYIEHSARQRNVYAMDKLATELLNSEERSEKDILWAKSLLEEASEMQYDKATYHLAEYFYTDSPLKYEELYSIMEEHNFDPSMLH